MAEVGDRPARAHQTGGGSAHLAGFVAAGTLLAFVIAGMANMAGAGRVLAGVLGVCAFVCAVGAGALRQDPSTLALDERSRRQRQRSAAIGVSLGVVVLIFYATTIVRLGPNVLNKDGFANIGAKKNIVIKDDTKDLVACKKAGTC